MKHLILFFCTVVILASCQQNDPPAPSANNNNNNNNTTSMTPTEQALVGTWRWYKTEWYQQGNLTMTQDSNYYISNTGFGTYITELKNTLYFSQPQANPPISTRYDSRIYNQAGFQNLLWYVDPANSYYNANPKSLLWNMIEPSSSNMGYIDSLSSNLLITTSWGTFGPCPTSGVKWFFYK